MKTHRPWQPQMRNDPLFNPFVPPTEQNVTLDHIAIPEEPEAESAAPTPAEPAATVAGAEDSGEKPTS